MSINRFKFLGRIAGLLIVTLFAGAVMWATGIRRVSDDPAEAAATPDAPPTLEPAAPVVVQTLTAEPIEVLNTYAGMLQPFERFSVGFEVAGRVSELGQNAQQHVLDEGDHVREGQVLAVLDQRILTARVNETTALLEQAQQELQRARQMRRGPNPAISETDYQTRVTELAVAEAKAITAQKNLEDATLKSPCDGIISLRMINAGESIAMHAPVFEIVQVDRVLLVAGVPESRVQELERRRRYLQEAGQDSRGSLPFRVHVQLMGRDRFGTPWPPREGEVFRIGETADDKTGLFEVEILLENADGHLKPGLVAEAGIVVDELLAYRVPLDAVMFRGSTPYFFAVQQQPTDLKSMFWNLGPQADFFAKQVPLNQFIEQEGELIAPEIATPNRQMVIRGQHRLVDGRRIRIVNREANAPSDTARAPEAAKSAR